MARQQSLSGGAPQLKAVHRIERGEGKVVQPGEMFYPADPPELERLLRLGAAVAVAKAPDEEPIEES